MNDIQYSDRWLVKGAWALVLAVCLSACTIEHSGNGRLDGFWHLLRIDTIATGGAGDYSERLLFWAVQGTLLQTSDFEINSLPAFVMHFEYGNSQLRVYDVRHNDRPEGDPEVYDLSDLRPYGINATDETFQVEQLTGSTLVLRGELLRLYFRKQ
ncbi:MAG: lipocalin-like domain-containing protein [Prevotella sp.]